MDDAKQGMDKKKEPFIFILMVGVFTALVGVMGFIRSPEITDGIMLVSGLAMIGSGLYRLTK